VTASKSRSVLILGANPETATVVEIARNMKLRTIVSNPFPTSPAKAVADKSFDVDPRNETAIDSIIRGENVEAVVLGVSDPLLSTYLKICSKYRFPCYANEKAVRALSSKAVFAKSIERFKIKSTPQFGVLHGEEESLSIVDFPVVTKPVDAGAAAGVSLCSSADELKIGIRVALSSSIRGEVVVEKAMFCDDLMAYYTFRDSRVFLTALADRHKSIKQGGIPRVCLMTQYPSRHIDRFLTDINLKLIDFFKNLEIENGVLAIQFFFDGVDFYAYDPGFRLQGEAPHLYVSSLIGFDQRVELIKFAMGESFLDPSFDTRVDPYFKGKFARTLWMLGSPGTISFIGGIDEISKHSGIISVQPRFKVGDKITEQMIGTEKQVLFRIHTMANSLDELDSISDYVNSRVVVVNQIGESLIQDQFVGN
jgi:biotin carboxylase